jgi:hypothetical protein
VLHPAGDVSKLTEALSIQYDAFYDDQPRVRFDKCEKGYIKESEGPQQANIFDSNHLISQPSPGDGGDSGFKYQAPWHYYV